MVIKMEMIICKCGCGRKRPKYDSRGRECTFIHGHQSAMPDIRKKISVGNKGLKRTEKQNKRNSDAQKIKWKKLKADPERYSKWRKTNSERDCLKSENFTKLQWKTIKKFSQSNLGLTPSTETLEKMSIAQKNRFEDKNNHPLYGKHHSDESKKKMSESTKELWKDIEYAKMMIKGFHIKPNKKELLLNSILQEHYPNDWKYVGDGDVIIGGKCPDFININGKKAIIEMNGDYFHSEERTGRTRKDEEKQRIDHFKEYGYKTLIIWERELENIDKVIDKIGEIYC